MLSVKFNDHELNEYIGVLKGFTTFTGAAFSPIVEENKGFNTGADFLHIKKGMKKISMPFIVRNNLGDKYDNLQKVLNVSEPKPLIFGHMPNRVFYAIPDGDLDFDEIQFLGKGTINWVIPSGRSFSTEVTSFSSSLNDDNVLEFEIENTGSESVPVDYRIKLKKESGFIGLVSEYGAMQFGLVNEADGTMVESDKSKQLTNNTNGNFDNWTNGTTFYQDQNKKSVTTMSANDNYGLGILPASFSNTTNSNFFGAIKEIPLSESARNWYLWAQAWFETGRMGQTGMWTLAIVDEQNKPIAAYILRKGDTTGNKAQCYFWLNGKIVKTFDFTASYWEKDNPYGSESKNARRNPFDIRKEGNRVRFFWRGSYYYYTDSAIENVKASKVQFFVGQFKGRNTSTQKVTHMYINNLAFTKLNVETWRDDPNRFPNNSEIFISGSETLLYLNEMARPDDEIRGSTWFKVPPGLTTVQLLLSDFAEVESATAELRREYL